MRAVLEFFGAFGVVPPTMAEKLFEMRSQRLLLLICVDMPGFRVLGASGAVPSTIAEKLFEMSPQRPLLPICVDM